MVSQDRPADATHTWSATGQYAKRSAPGWAIWQDQEWLWIGPDYKGAMVPLTDKD